MFYKIQQDLTSLLNPCIGIERRPQHLSCVRKHFKLNIVQEKVVRILNRGPKLYPVQRKVGNKRISRTTSKLLRSKKGLPVGACHHLCNWGYDNNLYNLQKIDSHCQSFILLIILFYLNFHKHIFLQ